MTKRFCVALAIAMILLMAVSFLPIHGEKAVYDTVVRLHVLADSDDASDQALKLLVRDEVLKVSSPLLAGCRTQDEAVSALQKGMPAIQKAAESVILREGRTDRVTVRLGREKYPTRVYEDCSFPAGTYVSLRVCIGRAEGHNWWCVLFPPLCLSAATAEKQKSGEDFFVEAGLSKDQYGIITETGKTKYKVRFRLLELFEELFD